MIKLMKAIQQKEVERKQNEASLVAQYAAAYQEFKQAKLIEQKVGGENEGQTNLEGLASNTSGAG